MSKKTKSNLMILIATFIWGTAFLAQKDGGRIGTFTFNGLRFLIGGTFLLPVICVLDRLRAQRGETADDGGHSWNREVLTGGVFCGIALFIASSLQQYGVLYTTIGKTGFITSLYTVFVPVLSVILGKKVRPLTWVAVMIGMTGLYFISMYGESMSISYGDRFVLGCAFAFAVQILAVDHFSTGVDPVRLAAVEFLTLGIISLFFMFTFENPNLPDVMSVLPSLLYASIFSSGVAYTLQVVGQKYAEPTQAAIMMCMESVFSLLTGMIVLGERMPLHQYFGAALILTAVILAQLPGKTPGQESGNDTVSE